VTCSTCLFSARDKTEILNRRFTIIVIGWLAKLKTDIEASLDSVFESFQLRLGDSINVNEINLGWKDKIGYLWEMSVLEELRDKKLYKYVKYRNPKNPQKWKKTKKKGVDIVLKIGCFTFYLECRFKTKRRIYRYKWFRKTVKPRFKEYPQDMYHFHIVLTNRPSDFEHVEPLLKENRIFVFDLATFTVLIKKLANWLEPKYIQLKIYQQLNERKELNAQLNLKSLVNRFNYPDLLKQLKPITTLRNLWKPVLPTVQRPLTKPNTTNTLNTLVTKQVSNNKYTNSVYAYVEELIKTILEQAVNKPKTYKQELEAG